MKFHIFTQSLQKCLTETSSGAPPHDPSLLLKTISYLFNASVDKMLHPAFHRDAGIVCHKSQKFLLCKRKTVK